MKGKNVVISGYFEKIEAWIIIDSRFGRLMGVVCIYIFPNKFKFLILLVPVLTREDFKKFNLINVPEFIYHSKNDSSVPMKVSHAHAERLFNNLVLTS